MCAMHTEWPFSDQLLNFQCVQCTLNGLLVIVCFSMDTLLTKWPFSDQVFIFQCVHCSLSDLLVIKCLTFNAYIAH